MSELLRSLNQHPIAYYPIYKQATESTTGGILLSQVMFWFSYHKVNKIFKTDEQCLKYTDLTINEFRAAKLKLKELPFLTITREGIPAKTYYEIDWKSYEEHLKSTVSCKTLNKSSEINETSNVKLTNQDKLNSRYYNRKTKGIKTKGIKSFNKLKPRCDIFNSLGSKGKQRLLDFQKNILSKEENKFLSIFKYSLVTQYILYRWSKKGGKNYVASNAKVGPKLNEQYIQALFIEGINPYSGIDDDNCIELNQKKWKISDVVKAIDKYAGNGRLTKGNCHFHDFVLTVPKSKNQKNQRSYSSLVDYFKLIDYFDKEPKVKLSDVQVKRIAKLKAFIQSHADTKPYLNGVDNKTLDTICTKTITWLAEVETEYKVHSGAAITYRKNMFNLFKSYLDIKFNNTEFKVGYIQGGKFPNEFIADKLKDYGIEKIKKTRRKVNA